MSLVGWRIYDIRLEKSVKINIITESLSKKIPPIDKSYSGITIFPEYSFSDITNSNLHQRIETDFSEKEKIRYFIASEKKFLINNQSYINNLIAGDTHHGIKDTLAKQRLIPGGEDLSYAARIVLKASSQEGPLRYFKYGNYTQKGHKPLKPIPVSKEISLGAAVCSSVISTEDYRKLTNNGASLLTNSASLTVFNNTPNFTFHHKSLSKFMAVANARYYAQSSNGANAFVISNKGDVIFEGDGHGVWQVEAKLNKHKTLYTILGEWMAIIGAVFVTIRLFLLPFRNKSKEWKD